MTPIEAAQAAMELAQRMLKLAELDAYQASRAAELLEHHAEAGELAEQIRFHLLTLEVPA